MRTARVTAQMAEPQVRSRINRAYETGNRAAVEDELARLDDWTRETGDRDPLWAALRGYAAAVLATMD